MAVAGFVMAAKQAEDILLVLNGETKPVRESPPAGARRLDAPAAPNGRLCELTWDPLAIDCRSKAPVQAHPEIALPTCSPDPNRDGADTPCLVQRWYKSDSEILPAKVVADPLVLPDAATVNKDANDTGRTAPGAALSTTRARETSRTRTSPAAAGIGAQQIGQTAPRAGVFEPPLSDGKRVDICLNWGSGCGQAAADAFCQKAGFARAAEFTVAEDIGAESPTLVIGDGKLCSEAFCDGFAMIRCAH